MSTVVTGEAVQLDLKLAAVPSRAVARLLDALIQAAVGFLLVLLVGITSTAVSDAAASALALVSVVLVLLVYPITFETLTRGRTPGKAVMGLRVVRDDGGPIGFRHAFARGLAGLVDNLTVGITAVIVSLLNERNKRIGDFLAGTVVLRERVPVTGGPVAVVPPPLVPWAQSLDLSGLPDDVAVSARQFVARAPSLTETAREDLGGRLVTAVLAVVSPPPPPGTPGWAVLAAVLAERRRRDEQRLAARAPAASAAAAGPPAEGNPQAPAESRVPDPPPPSAGGYAPPT